MKTQKEEAVFIYTSLSLKTFHSRLIKNFIYLSLIGALESYYKRKTGYNKFLPIIFDGHFLKIIGQ